MQPPFRSVLCPTDASPSGDTAVAVAYHLVGRGGTVHLLHVCEPPFLGNPLYTQYVQGYVPTPEEQRAGEEQVRQQLHALPPAHATQAGVRTDYHLVHGVNVADEIEQAARRLGVDAVVLGTRGRTGLSRLLLGSVANDLVKRDLPVILVHTHAPKEETPAPRGAGRRQARS